MYSILWFSYFYFVYTNVLKIMIKHLIYCLVYRNLFYKLFYLCAYQISFSLCSEILIIYFTNLKAQNGYTYKFLSTSRRSSSERSKTCKIKIFLDSRKLKLKLTCDYYFLKIEDQEI